MQKENNDWYQNWQNSINNPEIFNSKINKIDSDLEELRVDTLKKLEQLKEEMDSIDDTEFLKMYEEYEEDKKYLKISGTIQYKNQVISKSINKPKIPFIKKFNDLSLETKKKIAVIGVASFASIVGISITAPKIYQVGTELKVAYEQDRDLEKNITSFSKNSIIPNTTHIGPNHSHDYTDIFMNAKLQTEDPIVALYLFYEATEEDCVNKGMLTFNRLFGTNYQDLNDFLQKNNFNKISEWRSYVRNEMAKEQEAYLDGNNSLGR